MKAAAPRISVAMSVYNDAPFLRAAIDSILGQTFTDFEFIIVDDGSTDGSGTIIDDYARRDPRVRVVHQSNRGLVYSLNRAIRDARGEFIARMDGDDISLPERFARQIAFFDAHPDHGLLGTNFLNIDVAGQVTPDVECHPLDHADIVAEMERRSIICHPSVMMRRSEVMAAGLYRPAYRHCEDFDLWLRLMVRTRMANLPERLVQYRRSEGQVSVRHVVAQQTHTAIALLAHAERQAGRPDPTDGMAALPALDDLDAVFGQTGLASRVRSELALRLGYSDVAMRGEGFDILVAHVRQGGERTGLWRTALRLLKFGLVNRAIALTVLLVLSGSVE